MGTIAINNYEALLEKVHRLAIREAVALREDKIGRYGRTARKLYFSIADILADVLNTARMSYHWPAMVYITNGPWDTRIPQVAKFVQELAEMASTTKLDGDRVTGVKELELAWNEVIQHLKDNLTVSPYWYDASKDISIRILLENITIFLLSGGWPTEHDDLIRSATRELVKFTNLDGHQFARNVVVGYTEVLKRRVAAGEANPDRHLVILLGYHIASLQGIQLESANNIAWSWALGPSKRHEMKI